MAAAACRRSLTGVTTGMPPTILVLNDDVLRHLADYLLGKDALALSLASKHVYDLAIHRVSAFIECKDRDKLWTMHRTLFYDNPERAKHIRTFIIRRSVFPPEEWDEWKVLESPAPLIGGLLRIACNIRCLTIESFDILRASDPNVVAAMTALRMLSKLELFGIQAGYQDIWSDDVDSEPGLGFLQTSGLHLAVLSLQCVYYDDEAHLNPLLLSTIAAFPQLVTLRLIQFFPTLQSSLELDGMPITPSFPSIRELILDDTTPHGFALVRLCPNASLVSISIHDGYGGREASYWQSASSPRSSSSGMNSRWNPLHSLILSSEACKYSQEAPMGPAFHLRARCPVSSVMQPDGSDAPDLLLDTLRKVSPVRAQLSMEAGRVPTVYMWERLAESAPRLRFLELKITLDDLDALQSAGENEDVRRWLDGTPDGLYSVPPLLCLRLHFTKVTRDIDYGDDEYGPLYFTIPKEEIEETYNAGTETRKRLPRWCADIIPTLKYIAVADEDPCWDDECHDDNESDLDGGARCTDWESVDERYGGEAEELYQLQDQWYSVKIKTLRWWRVERTIVEGKRKTSELQPLTAEQGKEVQKLIEKADQGSFESIDEFPI